MPRKHHNAHMLIPIELWARARKIAERDDVSMTQLVCDGLAQVIASRNQETKGPTQ